MDSTQSRNTSRRMQREDGCAACEDMREELNARVAILRSEHRILLDELRARGCEPAVVPEEPTAEGLGFDRGVAAEMGSGAEAPGR